MCSSGVSDLIKTVSPIVGALTGIGGLLLTATQGQKSMKYPTIQAAPAAPVSPEKPSQDKVQSAADKERRRILSRSGRAGTIATGGLGLIGTPATTTRTLLGGQ